MVDVTYEVQIAPKSTWKARMRFRGVNGLHDAIERAEALPSTIPVRVVEIKLQEFREVWLNEAGKVKVQKRKRSFYP